jgi:hypothetical protein
LIRCPEALLVGEVAFGYITGESSEAGLRSAGV